MRNKFYAATPLNAVRKVANEEIPLTVSEGTVISVGKNDVRVQVKGSGNSQPAYIGKGLTIEASDRVLLVKSPRTSQWIVIGAYVNPQSSGNTSSSGSVNALAPAGLAAVPLLGGFLARCTVGVDTPTVLEFEVADDTAETNAVNLLIAGSVLPYATAAVKSVRVRSVDANWNRSGWTAWATATPMIKPLTASASTTVASTASQTSLLSTVSGIQTFAASALSTVGRQLRVDAWGYVSDTGTPTLQLRFKLGSTVILDSTAITLGSGISNKLWHFTGVITCQAAGASGKLFAQGQFTQNGVVTDIVTTAQISIDLTTSRLADLTAQWSASSASNTITCTNCSIEVLN